jgi:uncharacterized membrane protein YozB (DUF420 family)
VSREFLKSAAPFSSDLTLAVEVGMGLALLGGMLLARRGRYRAHAWCQSAVVLLNLVAITLTMVSSFRRSWPASIPAALHKSYYVVAGVHALSGAVAELLGLYILAVAGTSILPKRLRFTRYKPWMWTALALWWVGLLLGVGTYVRWYVAPLVK